MFFPELKDGRFLNINLDNEAQLWFVENNLELENPLLDPAVCQSFIQECHRRHQTDYSFGGWMESRSVLWQGSYLDEDERHIHLGVDYNVPEGTGISVHRSSSVIRVDDDHPEAHGWGNRVIVHDQQADVMVVFAHLDTPVGIRIGDTLEPGHIFAKVGDPSKNGGWFPHLHVQLIKPDYYHFLLKNDLRDLDGYGKVEDINFLKSNFPDPTAYLKG